ncbi:MAG TPA: RluA family pseudouridine synthase [Actinobacteria bacterium]|nr:RluA family pseudouridine synthase [Actinomycetes bacterium]HEX21302.1 RluA family pseudouridine synthase [Actinomycetota bacterium]
MSEKEENELIGISVTAADAGLRLDRYLAKQSLVRSRNAAQHLISLGKVELNGEKVKKNRKISLNDYVAYTLESEAEIAIEPEDIPLDIIYEDEDIIVISKIAGMVVHPAPGHRRGTLVNALLAHTALANTGGPLRPGIVHRLDKDTSGLLVAAKTDKAYYSLIDMLKKHLIKKRYLVLVAGSFKESSGEIRAAIGRSQHNRKVMTVTSVYGKPAVTRFQVIKTYDNMTLLEASLVTGRTHQIRVHMRFIDHKIIGDPIYGSIKLGEILGISRQFLHAYKLEFEHPVSGEKMKLISRLPDDLACALKIINKIFDKQILKGDN